MFLSRSAFYLMVVSSLLVALASYRFFALGLPVAFDGMLGHLDNRLISFVTHVVLAPLALFLGVFQFFPKLRSKRPSVHRWFGRLYGICVLVAGIAGFSIALGAEGGPIASTGFVLLSVVWIGVTALGIHYARAGLFAEHRRWMIRSFALTFAGVTLRLQLLGFMLAGIEYTEASVFLAWACWVPNLMAVEWWLRRKASQQTMAR